MLQEVKLRKPGLIRLKEFIIFEKHRENNLGGGLMTIAHEKMQPIQIPDEHSEFLQVDTNGGFGSIRTINCYGPQETSCFSIFLDTQQNKNCSIVLSRHGRKL